MSAFARFCSLAVYAEMMMIEAMEKLGIVGGEIVKDIHFADD